MFVVAECVQTYLAPDVDVEVQSRSIRLLWSALSRLLCEHLAGSADWSRWHWIDGVESETVVAASLTELQMSGLAIWSSGASAWWQDPVAVSVHLSPDCRALEGYTLWFGDVTTGLGRTPLGKRRRQLVRDAKPEWLYTFEYRAV